MLDLLLAANDAAHTEGRRLLLDGVLDGGDRYIRQALEDHPDHGELLDDDFFWAFMGLAGVHADRESWRTLRDHGYGMDTSIRLPEADDSQGWLDREGVSLGGWLAQFADPQRLDELQDWGLLKPWERNDKVGRGKVGAGELGLATGSQALFDYWLPQWKAQLEREATGARASWRKRASRSVPDLCKLAIGMEAWDRQNDPRQPYPSNWPSGPALSARVDALLETWLSAAYPDVSARDRLAAMGEDPPNSWDETHAGRSLDRVLAWQMTQSPNGTDLPLEILAADNDEIRWLAALLRAGFPLSRPQAERPFALAERLALAHAQASNGEGSPVPEVAAFVAQARKRDPAALDAFFGHVVPATGKRPARRAIFHALHNGPPAGVARLLEWGQSAETVDVDGTPLGVALLQDLVKRLDAPERAIQNLKAWLKRADPAHATAILADDRPYERPKGSSRAPAEPALLEFILLEGDADEALALLVAQGFPLRRQDGQQRSLGWSILAKAADGRGINARLWDAYRARAAGLSDQQIPPSYFHRTAKDLEQELEANPSLAMATLAAARLDERLAAPQPEDAARRRPRM